MTPPAACSTDVPEGTRAQVCAPPPVSRGAYALQGLRSWGPPLGVRYPIWIEAQPYCLGSGISLMVVRMAAGTCMPERKRRYVVCLMAEGAECTMPTTDAQASIQLATVGSHAVCCLSTLSYSSHPKPP